MYHVLCFPSRFSYAHMYAVHLLVKEKPPLEEALGRCAELFKQHVEPRLPENELEQRRKEAFCCVGYERVPIDIGGDYYAAVLFWWRDRHGDEPKVVNVVSDIPQELKEVLAAYRATRLAVDVDEPDYAIDAYEEARRVDPSARVYRTARGYHIKGRCSPRTFEELVELRRRMHDDGNRIAFDRAYAEAGLTHLLNVLFDEKCWLDEDGSWRCYAEAEVDPRTLARTVTCWSLPVELPERVELDMVWGGRRMRVVARGDTVTVSGYIRASERSSVASAALELVRRTRAYRDAERGYLRKRLLEEYERVSRGAAWVLSQCAVSFSEDNSTVYVDVPEALAARAGLLIGRNGANARAVEAELGRRVVIRAPKTDAERARDRVRRLLEELTSPQPGGGGGRWR